MILFFLSMGDVFFLAMVLARWGWSIKGLRRNPKPGGDGRVLVLPRKTAEAIAGNRTVERTSQRRGLFVGVVCSAVKIGRVVVMCDGRVRHFFVFLWLV